MKPEIRFVEVRAVEGERVIEGTLAPYGSEAVIGKAFRERIQRGALSFDDVTLNVQHDRGRLIARTGAGLVLADGPDGLRLRAELPETRNATDAIEGVRAGLYRGLSVEFEVAGQYWTDEAGKPPLRTITRAAVLGAALVDRPAYSDATIAARAMEGYLGPGRRRLFV